MGHQFQIVTALAEDLGLVSRTPIRQHTASCNSSSKRFDNLFWPLGAPGHKCRPTHITQEMRRSGGEEGNKLRNCKSLKVYVNNNRALESIRENLIKLWRMNTNPPAWVEMFIQIHTRSQRLSHFLPVT